MPPTPQESTAISSAPGPSRPLASSPPSWSGLSTQSSPALTIIRVLETLSLRAFAMYFVGPPWRTAAEKLIESGQWVPFAAITPVILAAAIPEALAALARALRQVLPFVPGTKKPD